MKSRVRLLLSLFPIALIVIPLLLMPLVHASSEPASFATTICDKLQQSTDLTGACCDPATGSCTNDVLEADCQYPLQWNEGVPCDQVECVILMGACCDPATGSCTNDVLEADCQYPLQWNEGIPCDQVECEPKMTIDMDTSTPIIMPGGTVTYAINVTNADTATAINVSIWNTLPPTYFTYASTGTIITTGGATRSSSEDNFSDPSKPTWQKFTIPSGGSVVIPFTANVDPDIPPGTYQNTAYAYGDNFAQIDDLGDQGQDPGTPPGQDPEEDEDVTVEEQEEPPFTGVPTMSQWGMIAMGILFAALLIWSVRRRWIVRAGIN